MSENVCPKCGGYVPGHATGAGDICTCEPITLAASEMLRREVYNLCMRYGQESDITVYQTLGVLEVVKMDLVDALERIKR